MSSSSWTQTVLSVLCMLHMCPTVPALGFDLEVTEEAGTQKKRRPVAKESCAFDVQKQSNIDHV